MADEKGSPVRTVLVTGLLALLGTVAGGLVKGYMDTSLADKKFQTDLVMKALEPDDPEARIKSLEFLVETNLVSDPQITNGVRSYLAKKSNVVPQFKPTFAPAAPGVVIPSTTETVGFTDFTVFICDAEWENVAARTAATSVIDALREDGKVGQVTLRRWASYKEIPLDALRDQLTLIIDRGWGEER